MQNSLNMRSPGNYIHDQFPYRLLQKDPGFCEWMTNTGTNFTEPFFDDTISRLRGATENQRRFKSVASLEMLPRWAKTLGIALSPAAIIFHVSRCGSTLLSQLLALHREHMVLSEVPFFDALLRLPVQNDKVKKTDAATWFQAALQFYIYSSPVFPEKVFVKTDSWHLHFYDQLRILYPGIPIILLYRQPWEIIQSQQRRRGMQSVPGVLEPEIFEFTHAQVLTSDLDEYMALVLESYFEKMIEIATQDANCILINYSEGATNAVKRIADATGIVIDKELEQAIAGRSAYHGKYPGQVFIKEQNIETAPGYLAPATTLYQHLETIRFKRASI